MPRAAVRGENAGGVSADPKEGGVAERDDAGIAEHEVDRESEQDGGEDLRAQRQVGVEHEIGGDGDEPRQRFPQPQAMAAGERRAHGLGRVGRGRRLHRTSPNRPRGRHNNTAMVSA